MFETLSESSNNKYQFVETDNDTIVEPDSSNLLRLTQ